MALPGPFVYHIGLFRLVQTLRLEIKKAGLPCFMLHSMDTKI